MGHLSSYYYTHHYNMGMTSIKKTFQYRRCYIHDTHMKSEINMLSPIPLPWCTAHSMFNTYDDCNSNGTTNLF